MIYEKKELNKLIDNYFEQCEGIDSSDTYERFALIAYRMVNKLYYDLPDDMKTDDGISQLSTIIQTSLHIGLLDYLTRENKEEKVQQKYIKIW